MSWMRCRLTSDHRAADEKPGEGFSPGFFMSDKAREAGMTRGGPGFEAVTDDSCAKERKFV